MLKRIDEAKIQTKLVVAPLVMVALFAVVAIVLFRAIDTGGKSLDAISESAIDLQFAVSDLSEATVNANTKIYRIMTLGGAMDDAESMQKLADGFAADIVQLQNYMASLEVLPAAQSRSDLIAALKEPFELYVGEATGAVEMALIDTATAVFMMSTAEAAYEELAAGLESLRASVRQDAAGLVADAQSEAAFSTTLAIVLSIVAVIIGSAVAWGIGVMIKSGIVNLSQTATGIAEGDLERTVDGVERTCEIGQMAKSLDFLRLRAKEADDLSAQIAAQAEERAERSKKVEQLIANFDRAVADGLGDMNNAFGSLSNTSTDISQGATASDSIALQVASAAEEASRNVGTVASAAEELSASIAEVNNLARTSTGIVQTVSNRTDGASTKVKDLAEAAAKIGEVTKLITDIASQTNLLALNATIEAARAGEAGKGFAVVATEVKSLASETEKATNEIGTQIGAIQTITQDVVSAISGVGESIVEVESAMSSLAETVSQQANATQLIAQNATEASAGTHEVSARIAEASAQVSSTRLSADSVIDTVGQCTNAGKTLQERIETFLQDVRVA